MLARLLRFLLRILKFTGEAAESRSAVESDCDCQPLEVPDEEKIIRAIYYSVHVKDNGTLKWQAFKPTAGTDEISAMRGGCMSLTDCKRKAKELENPRVPKLYRGLAVLLSGAVRHSGMDVSDSRSEFCGHAHISTGVALAPRQDGEPEDPSRSEELKRIGNFLCKLCAYYPDEEPESGDWRSPAELTPPSMNV